MSPIPFFGRTASTIASTDSAGLTVDGTLVHVFGSGGLSRCTSPSIVNTDGTLIPDRIGGLRASMGEAHDAHHRRGDSGYRQDIANRPSSGSAPKAAVPTDRRRRSRHEYHR